MSKRAEGKWLPAVQAALMDWISYIPTTTEPKSSNPAKRSKVLVSSAATKSAVISGSLAIPPGPLGMITILPDLMAIWRVQAQMVADIAGAYGKQAFLGKEQMIYCLFRHAAGQAVRDLVARVGERVLIRRASLRVIQNIFERVGIRITQRIAAKAISRWIPVLGAGAMAAYAYWDTKRVGKTSIEFFSSNLDDDSSEELSVIA